MQQSGFRSAPLTRTLAYALVATSLLSSLSSTKHLFFIQLSPHLLRYRQFWRLSSFQTIYANAGELLFATLLLYHLRLVERMFGSRKFLSLVVYAFILTSVAAPSVLGIGWVLTGGHWNYLPPGPTPLLFALLAQYHAAIPTCYKFTVLLPGGTDVPELTLSDKWYVYLLASQLALCQPPGSVLAAAVGWVVGYAWRLDLLPKSRWRVGRWAVKMMGGEAGGREYEGLRRRLRGGEEEARENRSIMWRVLDQFRGQA